MTAGGPARAAAALILRHAAAVEVVTVGDELLLGTTIDANAAWIGRRLAAAGIRVARRATVGDDADEIRTAVDAALRRTRVVLCTGGLGPTRDDVTREAVAALFGRALRVDPALLRAIEDRFAARGIPMPERNRSQAEVPDGARVLPNPRGTAPGLLLEDQHGRAAVLLPGVPVELRAMIDEQVVPILVDRLPARPHPILHRVLRTTGIAESVLADRVEPIVADLAPLGIAFLPSTMGVDLRLTSWGTHPEAEARSRFDRAEAAVRARIGRRLYGRDDEDLADRVARSLRDHGASLAVAESCTGGLLGKRLTDAPGASDFFLGGVIAYDDDVKHGLLGVSRATLAQHGAVSFEVAREMASGVRDRTGADAAVAITGIAGPGGGSDAKPVGTVCIAAALRDRLETRRLLLPGDREEVRERAAQAGLALLLDLLVDASASP